MFAIADLDQIGNSIVALTGDLADMVDMANFRFCFDHAYVPDAARAIDQLDARKHGPQVEKLLDRHSEGMFRAEFHADAAMATDYCLKCVSQERCAIIIGLWRRPSADVVDPGCGHAGRANFRNDSNRCGIRGNNKEPGTGRALPELARKPGRPTDIVGRC